MFFLQQFLPGIVAAALISGLIAIVGRLWKANGWMDAFALGIGYAAGHAVFAGWPAFPPSEATHWLPYLALLSLFLGICDALLRPPFVLRASVWIVWCAGFLRLLLNAKFLYGWTLLGGLLWVIGLTLGAFILVSFIDFSVRHDPSISSLLVLAVVAGGTGITLMLSGSMLLGQLGLALAGALVGVLAAAALLPKGDDSRGIVPIAATLLTALWICGCFYADLPPASAFLLGLASLPALLLTALGKKTASFGDLLLRAGIAALPVLISLLLALHASPSLDY
jgi:hypothetical protein